MVGQEEQPSPGVELVERRFPLPDLPGFASGAIAAPAAPATPRFASTVMLVWAGERGGVEVFMLRRVSTMAFAPDAWVFPGGGVDARDADPALPWAGPSPQRWAAWLGCEESRARELVVAAAREVFEECGVLLAGPDEHTVVADVATPDWAAARAATTSRERSFAEVLTSAGLALRTDLLRPHARWITPEVEPRRYDTAFFAALVPGGQRPDDATSEAARADWVAPAALLAEQAAGRAAVLPPTAVALERLAGAADPAAFVADTPPYVAVLPTVEVAPGGGRHLTARIPR